MMAVMVFWAEWPEPDGNTHFQRQVIAHDVYLKADDPAMLEEVIKDNLLEMYSGHESVNWARENMLSGSYVTTSWKE